MRPKASSEGSYGRWDTCHLSLDGEGVLAIGKGRTGQARLADLLGDLADGVSEVYLTGRVRVSEPCRKMVAGLRSAVVMDLRLLDTSAALDMSAMLQGCASLEEVDASGWDTCGVFDMSQVFDGCASLVDLDFLSWTTSPVCDMDGMFSECVSLASLDSLRWEAEAVPRPSEPRVPVGLVPRSRLKLARRGRRAWPETLAEGELF